MHLACRTQSHHVNGCAGPDMDSQSLLRGSTQSAYPGSSGSEQKENIELQVPSMLAYLWCHWGLHRHQRLINSDLAYLLPPPEAHSSLWRASAPASLDSAHRAPVAASLESLVASEQDPLTRSAWRRPRKSWHSSASPPGLGLQSPQPLPTLRLGSDAFWSLDVTSVWVERKNTSPHGIHAIVAACSARQNLAQ